MYQAITASFLRGKAFGCNKTVCFRITAPTDGEQLRIRFSNRRGSKPYEIGAMRAFVGGSSASVTLNGKERFSIPTGGITVSDIVVLPVKRGEDIEIRMYYTNAILDNNMIEQDANLLSGNRTASNGSEPLKKPFLAKVLGAYNGIPAIKAVEILTENPVKAIVAFGDSITALSQWTKPLAKRIAKTYPGEYTLLNSGITGNCLLYKVGGLFGPVFGEKGTDRFERDVLNVPNLDTVIFGLGVNDVSYLSEQTASEINLEKYQQAVTQITNTLHERGVRVVMQTITPRLGVARTMGKYNREMEALRLQLNEWIRSAGIRVFTHHMPF